MKGDGIMKNVNQIELKSLEERQAELYETEDKLYEQMRELKKQQEQLGKEKVQLARDLIRAKLEYINEHRDVILALFKHTGTCSDENPKNGFKYYGQYDCDCKRCGLISLLNRAYEYDVDFNIDIEFTKLE